MVTKKAAKATGKKAAGSKKSAPKGSGKKKAAELKVKVELDGGK